jgi:hypothetical protein
LNVLRTSLHVAALVLLICAAGAAQAADPQVATVRQNTSPEISLDGRLIEAAWRDAPVLRLTQQSPKPGEPTRYQTEVRIIVTTDKLYFGFICHDPEPQRIAVHTMDRDGDTSGDDTVSIVLDTYGDRRTGYFFQINAAAARIDGLISGPDGLSRDWDGIWDAGTQETPDGWSAEIVIPTRTLSFGRGLTRWGLNVERFVPRQRLTLRWASPTLDSSLYDFTRAGGFEGVGGLEQGRGLELAPYGVARTSSHFQGTGHAWQGAAGGEFTWKITPQLVTVFTANTDFAETEVDTRQVNLTRFPLFFPEKRAFFLEGSNQYEFGLALTDQFIPFFSRTIGLLNGENIPIDAGVKVNGRLGRWNVAALDVQTRDTTTANSGFVPGTNLLAGRVSYDFTDKLRIGTVFTNGTPTGIGTNRLVGLDAVYRTSTFLKNKNLSIGGWTARTDGDVGSGQRQGGGFKVDYPNDLWDCYTSFNIYGDALNPALGFLPRPGIRESETYCAWQPRPRKDGPLGWIRQTFVEDQFRYIADLKGNLESWNYFFAPVNFRMEAGDRFEINYYPHFERLTEPFAITPKVVIPPGSYLYHQWRFEAQSSPHRTLQGGTTTWFGEFFDGHLIQEQDYVRYSPPGAHWELEVDLENDFARLREGSFVDRLWQFKGAYAWNPNLVLSTFIQYDNTSQNVGTNTRLRWTIRPGNELFIIWNRGWQRIIRDPNDLNLAPSSEMVAVKLRWTFRK